MNLTPLFNKQAEESVIGAIILDCIQNGNNNIISRVALTPEDFYNSTCQKIFRAMLELNRAEIPIDTITLSARLQSDYAEISRIASESFTAANIEEHIRLVRTNADKRKLQRLCLSTLDGLNDSTGDLCEAIGTINKQLKAIVSNRGGEIVGIKEVARDVLTYLDRRSQDREHLSGIPTGFNELDIITDGFQPGDLVILAGRPGKGKSAVSMAIVQNAVSNGFPCGVVSLEMGKHQIGIRQVASLSGVELWKLHKGRLSNDHYKATIKAIGSMADLPLFFSFTARKLTDIQKTITKMVEVHKVRLIVLDYLQLARNPEAKGNREREIGEISTALKHMALIHEIPILCIAQLNRQTEQREHGKPYLSDLRDSGQLEQDADVVIFLYDSDRDNIINVDIAKGRNIGIGSFKLHFNKATMTFGNL